MRILHLSSRRSRAAVLILMALAAGLVTMLAKSNVAEGQGEAQVDEASFALLAEPPRTSADLPAAEGEKLRALGRGYAAVAERDGSFRGHQRAASEDGRAIASGSGAVHRVEHASGVTIVVVRQGTSLCSLEIPYGGGGCSSSRVLADAPPVSVTQEDDRQRVVALLPDGTRDVMLIDADGRRIAAIVQRNIAIGRTAQAAALTWTDARGTPRRVTFSSHGDDPAVASASRARELADIVSR